MEFFGSNLKIERIKNQKNNWVLKIVTVATKCDFKHYVNTETPECISLNIFFSWPTVTLFFNFQLTVVVVFFSDITFVQQLYM